MTRSIFLIVCTTLLLLAVSSCVTVEKIADGTQAFQYKKYSKAIPMLKTEIEKESDESIKAQKLYYLAESYRETDQAQLAASSYAQAVEAGYDHVALLKQVQMLKILEKYDEAIVLLQKYNKLYPEEKSSIQKDIKACQDAQEWKSAKTGCTLTNLACNSAQDDFCAVLYEGGLVFTSSRESATGDDKYDWNLKKYYDIFYTKWDAKTLRTDTVSPFRDLNSDFHEGPCSFSRTGQMYYTKCGDASLENSYCQIYMRQSNGDGTWSAEQVLYPFPEKDVNCIQPFVSNDGKTLYFSSDIDAGVGGYDLYMMTSDNDTWSEPQNLGSSINTDGNELFPTLDDKGTLYFSSDTWQGMGGLDIYRATRTGKRYSIENLKSPINSGADDFAYLSLPITATDRADSIVSKSLLSSNRAGGKGMDDLYSCIEKIIPAPPVLHYEVDLHVIEKIYSDSLNPNSAVIDSQDIDKARVLWITTPDTSIASTSPNGHTIYEVDSVKNILIKVSKSGYFAQSKNVSMLRDKRLSKDSKITTYVTIVLDKIYKDKEIILDDIYYDYDSTAIRADAALVLDRLAKILIENPDLKIQMGSHTDCRGSAVYNQKLSQGRADKAVAYLVKKGIDAARLSAKGYGESEPISACECKKCTEEDHQKNRRSTFKVMD